MPKISTPQRDLLVDIRVALSKVSATDVAKALTDKVTRRQVVNIRDGKTANPTWGTMVALADYLGVAR